VADRSGVDLFRVEPLEKLGGGGEVDMKIGRAGIGALLLAAVTAPLAAQRQPASPATVRPHLGMMAMEAGTWDADITFPSNEAGKPDRKARGVQVNELRSGGLWMLNRFSIDGMPYEGTGVWGYDRVTGRYSGVWTDNNDSQMRMDDGRWDEATKTMTWTADMAQPDGRHTRLLLTEEFRGETRNFRIVALTRKGEVPLVSMIFTRRPGTAPTAP
jgi:hypothetical protein